MEQGVPPEDIQNQDVLSQLGIELPNNIDFESPPMNPAPTSAPQQMFGGLQELVKSVVAGAVVGLEEALMIVGYSSEEGKKIAKAIDLLVDVAGEENVKAMKQQMAQMMQAMASHSGPLGGQQNLTTSSFGL